MAPPSAQVAELELSVVGLQQREKRLRAVLSSAFTSRESRRTAREELESLLDKTEAAEDELLLLASPVGIGSGGEKTSEEPVSGHQPRSILRRRFRLFGRSRRTGCPE
jgi:hypothetical protein